MYKGKSGGKGKGGSGKGVARDAGAYAASPEEKRQIKKAGRREAQFAKVDAKGQAEADYFWECKAKSRRGTKSGYGEQSQAELFAQQTTFAIDFTKYESVEVTRSGPGADSVQVMHDFQDLGTILPKFVATCLELMQYRVPTPIQKHAIPLAMKGMDLMCCAQTGSGKTAAFLVPVVASLGASGRKCANLCDSADDPAMPRCIVMAPTRELIQQIHVEALKLCHKSGGLRAVVIYGGAQARQQLSELAQGCDIAVATPGRLTDFVDRELVWLNMVEHLVLDEADRMLDMGFEPQIRKLVQRSGMPGVNQRRTMMFSATFPSEIQKLAKEFMRPYVFIAVGRVGGTTENIEQRLVWASAEKRHKFDILLQELRALPDKTLVFVQKKRVATQLRKWLKTEGLDAEEIHGDRSQSQRESALAAFRAGEVQILCATDVAARGLDIPKVAHVINFDLPTSPDEFDAYVHRIGRTGRAGNTGVSTSFYVPGRDPKVGNAGIAPALARIFNETKNELPDWFLQLPEAASLRNGKAVVNTSQSGSGDIRSSKESVKIQTSTKHSESSLGVRSDAGAASFQNAITALEHAAQKRGLAARFEETPDPEQGFWCEAIVSSREGVELLRESAWHSKKKDAKYEAAKVCLAPLEALPQSRLPQNSVAAHSKTGVTGDKSGSMRAREAPKDNKGTAWSGSSSWGAGAWSTGAWGASEAWGSAGGSDVRRNKGFSRFS